MKIVIEVRGGVVQDVLSTDPVSIYLIDHDNIKEKGDISKAKDLHEPDFVGSEEEVMNLLKEILEEYE